jgi:hypothetical protein
MTLAPWCIFGLRLTEIMANIGAKELNIRIRKLLCKTAIAMNLYQTRIGFRDLAIYKEGLGGASEGEIEI